MLIGYMRVSSSDDRQVVDLSSTHCWLPAWTNATCIRTSSQVGATTAPA